MPPPSPTLFSPFSTKNYYTILYMNTVVKEKREKEKREEEQMYTMG
jgi:hypothetical protein